MSNNCAMPEGAASITCPPGVPSSICLHPHDNGCHEERKARSGRQPTLPAAHAQALCAPTPLRRLHLGLPVLLTVQTLK
eukprot:8413063-Alexandrium_andersonii.AAC.1